MFLDLRGSHDTISNWLYNLLGTSQQETLSLLSAKVFQTSQSGSGLKSFTFRYFFFQILVFAMAFAYFGIKVMEKLEEDERENKMNGGSPNKKRADSIDSDDEEVVMTPRDLTKVTSATFRRPLISFY